MASARGPRGPLEEPGDARKRARIERDIRGALDRAYRDAGERALRAKEPRVTFADHPTLAPVPPKPTGEPLGDPLDAR